MVRAQSARKLVDETWLRGSNGLLVVTRTRVRRDQGYQAAFRQTILNLFNELWPTDGPIDEETHLAAVHEDIDRMPLDLLDDLVDALAALAETYGSAQSPANGASRVLAGWLRTRAVELRGEGDILEQAGRLKQDYPELLGEVLGTDEMPVHVVPMRRAAEGARLDQLY